MEELGQHHSTQISTEAPSPGEDLATPSGCRLSQIPDGFFATVSLRSARAIPAVFAAVFLKALVVVFVVVFTKITPVLLILLVAPMAMGIALFVNAFLLCAGITSLRFDARAGELVVMTGIGPIQWRRRRSLNDVRGVARDIDKWLPRGKFTRPLPCLRIEGPRPIRFAGLTSLERRMWLYAVAAAAIGSADDIPAKPEWDIWAGGWRRW
jgi:hypothetical protein